MQQRSNADTIQPSPGLMHAVSRSMRRQSDLAEAIRDGADMIAVAIAQLARAIEKTRTGNGSEETPGRSGPFSRSAASELDKPRIQRAPVRGERSPHARLTEAQVALIHRSSKSSVDLARRLDVAPKTVRDVRAGRTWSHVKVGKLCAREVREIRASTASHRALARAYGVSDTTIRNVRNRRTWKHVEDK